MNNGKTAPVVREEAVFSNPWMITWSLGELVLVQPLRLGLDVLARTCARDPRQDRLRVPPMSSDWLRRHQADCEKHAGDL